MTDQEEWDSLLMEINANGSLSDWEENFVDDMLKLSESGKSFTKAQGLKIEQIYAKCFHS